MPRVGERERGAKSALLRPLRGVAVVLCCVVVVVVSPVCVQCGYARPRDPAAPFASGYASPSCALRWGVRGIFALRAFVPCHSSGVRLSDFIVFRVRVLRACASRGVLLFRFGHVLEDTEDAAEASRRVDVLEERARCFVRG